MLVHIKRQNKADSAPFFQTFEYKGNKDITVAKLLNLLNSDDLFDINKNPCEKIAWECSCMQAVCGACAMVVNKTPVLACECNISYFEELTIEPLSKFDVVHDLIVDRSVIFENLKKAELYLTATAEKSEKLRELQYISAKCMKCGLCLEICPNYNKGEFFYGAALLPEAFLTYTQGNENVKKVCKKHFLSSCSKAKSCQSICPQKIHTLSELANI